MRAPFSLRNRDWSLQCKAQLRFGRQIDLLRFGCRLHTASCARTCDGADGGSFTSSKNAAQDCAHNRASTDFFRGVFATRRTFAMELVGLNLVTLISHDEAVELQREQGLAFKLSCALYFHNVAFHFISSRYCGCTVYG